MPRIFPTLAALCLVACGDGALELLEVKPADKRAMPVADWLRGARCTVGQRLGEDAPA